MLTFEKCPAFDNGVHLPQAMHGCADWLLLSGGVWTVALLTIPLSQSLLLLFHLSISHLPQSDIYLFPVGLLLGSLLQPQNPEVEWTMCLLHICWMNELGKNAVGGFGEYQYQKGSQNLPECSISLILDVVLEFHGQQTLHIFYFEISY